MFFEKYRKKRDGAIRYFDIKSPYVKAVSILILIVCLLIVLVAIFPAIWVFFAGFKDIREFMRESTLLPSKFDFQTTYAKTWNDLSFVKFYINTLIVVAGSILCAVIFNGLIAYSLAIIKPKGHKIVVGLIMWSLLIPATTSLVALFVNISKIHLNQSFIPLWLAFGANAFYVIMFKQFYESLPMELIEAAKLDGCGFIRVFFEIIIPLSKSIVMVIVIFAVTASWSDFLLPYLVLNGSGKETIMVKLFSFRTARTTDVEILRAVIFSIIPPTILFLIFQKKITEGAAAGAIKG